MDFLEVLGSFVEPLRPGSTVYITCPANADRFHPGATGRAIVESLETAPSSRSKGMVKIVQYKRTSDNKTHYESIHVNHVHPLSQVDVPESAGTMIPAGLAKSIAKRLHDSLDEERKTNRADIKPSKINSEESKIEAGVIEKKESESD